VRRRSSDPLAPAGGRFAELDTSAPATTSFATPRSTRTPGSASEIASAVSYALKGVLPVLAVDVGAGERHRDLRLVGDGLHSALEHVDRLDRSERRQQEVRLGALGHRSERPMRDFDCGRAVPSLELDLHERCPRFVSDGSFASASL
jgi:hypothetical protein